MQKVTRLIIMEPCSFLCYSIVNFIERYYQHTIKIVSITSSLSELHQEMCIKQFDVILTDVYGKNESLTSWREFYPFLLARHEGKGCVIWTNYNMRSLLIENNSYILKTLSKKIPLQQMHRAIKNMTKGKFNILKNLKIQNNEFYALSSKEYEVIFRFLKGESLTKIAATSNKSIKTISTQKISAMLKLQVKSNAELLLWYKNLGGHYPPRV